MAEERDGRRRRGDRSRRMIARAAAAQASLDGLTSVTLGGLAETLGISKSSVQAAFPTKEALQLAAQEAATATFVQEVVAPAQQRPEGVPRLWALVDAWIGYVERRVFPGGCFIVANLAEFDSRPGSVHDGFAAGRAAWLGILERQVAAAQADGSIAARPSARMVAFEIDALLMAANLDRNFADDTRPLRDVRALIALRLGTRAPRRRGRVAGASSG